HDSPTLELGDRPELQTPALPCGRHRPTRDTPHDLVYDERYASVRTAARRSNPRINLRHNLISSARQARWEAHRRSAKDDAEALAEWERAVARYPRIAALSRGYVVAAAWNRVKRYLRL